MQNLVQAALGNVKADMVVVNGQVVNVNSGEIYPGGVAVKGERIVAVGDVEYTIGDKTEIIDAQGQYLVPGFIEGHIHPESSCLSMSRFAELLLCRGTTTVFTDLHEIGVVGGIEAIKKALAEGNQTPLRFYLVLPSHVPFSPHLETSGGSINSQVICEELDHPDVVGLSEIVSFYVAGGEPDLLKSIEATRNAGKVLCGHGPETMGASWNAFAITGIMNDHEALNCEEVLERIRSGVHAQLRHNPIVPTLPELVKAITEEQVDTRLLSLATDDTNARSLVQEGHLDHLVRMALGLGVDFMTAIQMVTINAASAFRLDREIGSLAPGRYGDINIVTGTEDFRVLKTIAKGQLVAEDGQILTKIEIPKDNSLRSNSFNLSQSVQARDLVISANNNATGAKVQYMKTLPWIPITEGVEGELTVQDGYLKADVEQDILHIAVVERHHATGNVGKAFIGGFGLKEGAIASSFAHDNHNIVVMGANPADMARAVNRVAELGGGIVVVNHEQILGEIELPILGLMSDQDAWVLANEYQKLTEKAATLGCSVPEPFMFLSFITLAAIPNFAVTDRGYIDCQQQKIMEPVLEWISASQAKKNE